MLSSSANPGPSVVFIFSPAFGRRHLSINDLSASSSTRTGERVNAYCWALDIVKWLQRFLVYCFAFYIFIWLQILLLSCPFR
ncbi:uncharacterized protein DS421_3g70030 [Arachis hypogaea]|nr:uncharacterized protein DS421_3g70030 [Arachis hypogaea]